MKKQEKRTSNLFVRIKPKNKKFIEKESVRVERNHSQYVDALLDKERAKKKKST